MRAELAARRIHGSDLASALGITNSTMSRRLRGLTSWPVDDLEMVADYLGVSVESLLTERNAA